MALRDFSVIGDYYLNLWGRGYEKDDYLKVLLIPTKKLNTRALGSSGRKVKKTISEVFIPKLAPTEVTTPAGVLMIP